MPALFLLRRVAIIVAAVLAGLLGNHAPAAGQCSSALLLRPFDRGASDIFGYSVAISGDTAIVGAPGHVNAGSSSSGAVYVYIRSGAAWLLQQEIVVAGETHSVGYNVAINGDTILIDCATGGKVYVFTRSGAVWTQQTAFSVAPDVNGHSLGLTQIGLSHLAAIVGSQTSAVGSVQGAGVALIYTLDTLHAGSVWTLQTTLSSPSPSNNGRFGFRVAIWGSTAVIGALGEYFGNGTGAAYVFTSNSSGGGWAFQARLPTPQNQTNFGVALSVHQDTAVVLDSFLNAASIFGRGVTGNWALVQSPVLLGNSLASSVRVIGDTMVIGESTGIDKGRLDLLTRPPGSGIAGIWTHKAVLRYPDTRAGDVFGQFVDFSGTTVLTSAYGSAGAPPLAAAGAAYIFDISNVCQADADCSGGLSVADIFTFLNGWFSNAPGSDFDGDNVVSVQDIFAFLSAWFVGCA